VTIWGTAGDAGSLVASATATSLLEPELVSTLADNTAVLTIAPAVVTPTHRGPPVLRLSGGAFTPPSAARVGPAAIVKASFSVDQPVTLTIAVADDKAKQLTLLAKSQVGGLTAARRQPRLVYSLAAAGSVKLTLRVRNASLNRVAATGSSSLPRPPTVREPDSRFAFRQARISSSTRHAEAFERIPRGVREQR
jgi:hypothetical protein